MVFLVTKEVPVAAVKFYQYNKCSTCRKAQKFLEGRSVGFKSIDITEAPPSAAELKKMLKFQGGDIKKLFNTSGLVYREMKLSQKIKDMSVDEAIQLLSSNGKLVKRPFVLTSDTGLVGFKEDQWKQVF